MKFRSAAGAFVAVAVAFAVCGERDDKHIEQEKVQEEPCLSYVVSMTTMSHASTVIGPHVEYPAIEYRLTDFRS